MNNRLQDSSSNYFIQECNHLISRWRVPWRRAFIAGIAEVKNNVSRIKGRKREPGEDFITMAEQSSDIACERVFNAVMDQVKLWSTEDITEFTKKQMPGATAADVALRIAESIQCAILPQVITLTVLRQDPVAMLEHLLEQIGHQIKE